MKKLPISIVILSWKANKTLRNTLNSYKKKGLLDLTDDTTVFFQEISQEDIDICLEFGIRSIGDSTNIGIGKAFEELFKQAKYDIVLGLENDWVIDIPIQEEVYCITESSINILKDGTADFVRLRHNKVPGVPLYTAQFHNREMDSPEHLIEQVHFLGKGLADKFQDIFSYLDTDLTEYVIGDSRYSNYSNNPFMCTKQFYLYKVAPYSGVAGQNETLIRESWMAGGYKVAFNMPGVFTHKRIDR
jgi:hypothetical protein